MCVSVYEEESVGRNVGRRVDNAVCVCKSQNVPMFACAE